MHLFVRKAFYCCWYPLLRIPVSMSKATNKIDLNPICTESYQPTAVYSFEFYDVSFLLFWCSNFHVHGHNVWYNCCHVWLQVTHVPVLHLQLRGCLAISAESGTSPSGIEPILRKKWKQWSLNQITDVLPWIVHHLCILFCYHLI